MSFPKYPEYKDSGVEWLGEVPVHWAVQRLKWSTASCRNGVWGDEPKGDENDILCIRVADFDRPRMRVSLSKPTYRNVTVNERKGRLVHPGDLLLEKSGGGEKQPVGFVVLYDDGDPAVCSNFVARIELSEGMSPSFWRYVHAAGYAVRLNVPSIKQTSGIQNLDQKSYLDEQGAFPPADEQIRIAAFLDHQTKKIDTLIAEQRRLIELLKEKRQAVISHAVTKGLDPNVAMKDSGVEWLGEVPVHWTVAALRWYATIQGGLAKGKKYGLDEPVVSRPYLRVANVQDGHFNLSVVHDVAVGLSEVSRYELREGDVLMNEGGDSDKLGRGAVWQGAIEGCLHQNHVFAIRPNRHLSATWLSMFTRSDSARSYFYLYSKQSTNLASISSRNVMACPVPIPPIKEQREILGRLSDALVQIDGLMDETEGAMALLQERRSALISAAVTGKIDVRGWSAAAEEPGLGMVAEESVGYSAQGGAA